MNISHFLYPFMCWRPSGLFLNLTIGNSVKIHMEMEDFFFFFILSCLWFFVGVYQRVYVWNLCKKKLHTCVCMYTYSHACNHVEVSSHCYMSLTTLYFYLWDKVFTPWFGYSSWPASARMLQSWQVLHHSGPSPQLIQAVFLTYFEE